MRPERSFADCRRRAGFSARDAALRLGLSPQYLRSLELGQVPLSLRTASRMQALYGVSIQILMTPNGADGTGEEGGGAVRKPAPPPTLPSGTKHRCRTRDTGSTP